MAELERELVIDATNSIAGRLCSKVAKLLLEGYRVVVVNPERALISGNRKSVIREWKEYLEVRSVINPKHTPRHPRRPDRIITEMIRGMVPRNKPKGIKAMKRLRVYLGMPEAYKGRARVLEEAMARRPPAFYTTIGELAKELGWKG